MPVRRSHRVAGEVSILPECYVATKFSNISKEHNALNGKERSNARTLCIYETRQKGSTLLRNVGSCHSIDTA